jgi:hypothetical protein
MTLILANKPAKESNVSSPVLWGPKPSISAVASGLKLTLRSSAQGIRGLCRNVLMLLSFLALAVTEGNPDDIRKGKC